MLTLSVTIVGFFHSSFFFYSINPTFKWDWANKPKLGVVVVPRSSNQTRRVFYLTSWVNLIQNLHLLKRFLSYGPILNSLYHVVLAQPF